MKFLNDRIIIKQKNMDDIVILALQVRAVIKQKKRTEPSFPKLTDV